jgi:hypothetical protein
MARSHQEDNILSRSILSMVRNPCRFLRVADAHRDDGNRFVVRADELLTALLSWNQRFRRLDLFAVICLFAANHPRHYFPQVES